MPHSVTLVAVLSLLTFILCNATILYSKPENTLSIDTHLYVVGNLTVTGHITAKNVEARLYETDESIAGHILARRILCRNQVKLMDFIGLNQAFGGVIPSYSTAQLVADMGESTPILHLLYPSESLHLQLHLSTMRATVSPSAVTCLSCTACANEHSIFVLAPEDPDNTKLHQFPFATGIWTDVTTQYTDLGPKRTNPAVACDANRLLFYGGIIGDYSNLYSVPFDTKIMETHPTSTVGTIVPDFIALWQNVAFIFRREFNIGTGILRVHLVGATLPDELYYDYENNELLVHAQHQDRIFQFNDSSDILRILRIDEDFTLELIDSITTSPVFPDSVKLCALSATSLVGVDLSDPSLHLWSL